MHIEHYPGFYMAGLSARTSNAKEMSGNGKIERIWETFLQPSLVTRIPNKVGIDLVAVYTDYETDHTGHYTYLLGLPVVSGEPFPSNLTIRQISSGRYAVITSERGQIAEVVRDAWQRIWSMSERELGGRRAFQTDFEIYDQRSSDPENAQIDIYIGLR